jgi:hypothetical protein
MAERAGTFTVGKRMLSGTAERDVLKWTFAASVGIDITAG